MIEFTKSFKCSDGTIVATLEEAQQNELANILAEEGMDAVSGQADAAADAVLKAKERVLDILTTTATSKPKARKINGGTKKRKVQDIQIA